MDLHTAKSDRLMRVATILLAIAMIGMIAGCTDSGGPMDGGDNTRPTGKISAADFTPAAECAACHPQHYDEWSGSMHAYAMTDPVFFAIRTEGQSQYVGALDQNCVQCHSPIGSRAGELPWGPIDSAAITPVVHEGITCDLCHTITSYSRLGTAGMEFAAGETKYGGIEDPVPTKFHKSEYNPLYQSSEYCGSCHDFITDAGLELERTFREWDEAGQAVTGKSCADCHMPAYTGKAAPGAPERPLHRHTFVGADVALIDFPNKEEQFALVEQMLRNALTMTVDMPESVEAGEELQFTVSLTNDKTGHNVPSGTSFRREMWLSVIVKDDAENVLYASGQLDANDDIVADEDLFNARSVMLRADGTPTDATWEAADLNNPSIRPGETRDIRYGLTVPSETTGALSVDVTLRFRSFSPSSLRSLGLHDLLPVPIIDMAKATRTVQTI